VQQFDLITTSSMYTSIITPHRSWKIRFMAH
jgi:hypothetical protein